MPDDKNLPDPPSTHGDFTSRFPHLADAWSAIAEAGRQGPLDAKTRRLIKLAVAMGALREGAVHASVRKALGQGVTAEELYQVVALSASTLGLPSAVACYTWIKEVVEA